MKLEERKLYNQVLKAYLKDFDKYIGIKKTKKEIKIVSHTVKKGIKRKMSAIKKVVISLNILSLLFLFACGEDNITNNTGNPPVSNDRLVLVMDSLVLNGTGINDTAFFNVLQPNDSLKATFTIETNCTITDTAYCAGNFGNCSFEILSNSMPNSFVFYGSYTNNSVFVFIQMITTNPRYIKLKSLKVYEVNPV